MQRTWPAVSSEMSPGINGEGLNDSVLRDAPLSLHADNHDEVRHVTVVGAGPAGLMLASNLARFGIKTTIIDDRPDKTTTGRADGLQPKTIETLRQLRLADTLLRKGVRIYDICFWNSSASTTLCRTRRDVHYPPEIVDVQDPYILLVHQGMVEDVFLQDLRSTGLEVLRSSPFINYTTETTTGDYHINVRYNNLETGITRSLRSRFLVGCDGAHSLVRKAMPEAMMDGESGKSAWGVLDGVIETDFPDLWSKAVISSETAGSILCIPRERNMTRLYIELQPSTLQTASSESATIDHVKKRAQDIIKPFFLSWKSVEWFGVYKVGQRVAKRFSDDSERVFITGDAAHTHSPKAAQGMNVSMHDSFNLAWKLNLSIRGLASPALLATYEQERRKIAKDLIGFDYEHANAFSAGDAKALADNFAKNIRFISGVGAEYATNILNQHQSPRGGCLKPGAILPPTKATRYVDSNPVDLQLDIPMLGQFRIYFLTHDIKAAAGFLNEVCEQTTSSDTILGRASIIANSSYHSFPPPATEMDSFIQPDRYTAVSKLFTYALVTTMSKQDVEISDLPMTLRDSKWTVYIDSTTQSMGSSTCVEKWLGDLDYDEVAIVNVRPDGYVGSIGRWHTSPTDRIALGGEAIKWLDEYYGGILQA